MLNTHGTRAGNCGPLGADLLQYKRPLSADGTHTTVPRCLRGKNGGVLQFQKIKKNKKRSGGQCGKEKKNRQNPSQNPQAVTAAKTKCSSVDLPGQIKEKYALFTKLSSELRPHPLWRHYRMSDGRMPVTDRQPSCHSQDLANHRSGLRPCPLITNPPTSPKYGSGVAFLTQKQTIPSQQRPTMSGLEPASAHCIRLICIQKRSLSSLKPHCCLRSVPVSSPKIPPHSQLNLVH